MEERGVVALVLVEWLELRVRVRASVRTMFVVVKNSQIYSLGCRRDALTLEGFSTRKAQR